MGTAAQSTSRVTSEQRHVSTLHSEFKFTNRKLNETAYPAEIGWFTAEESLGEIFMSI